MQEVLTLFMSEMQNDDVSIRVNTVYRLKVVVSLISADVLTQQLIPHLDQLVKTEEDEVLFALAKELKHVFLMTNSHAQVIIFICDIFNNNRKFWKREKFGLKYTFYKLNIQIFYIYNLCYKGFWNAGIFGYVR
jgi:hypothetical protein